MQLFSGYSPKQDFVVILGQNNMMNQQANNT